MTTIELGTALSVAVRVNMSVASARQSPSRCRSPSIFLAPYRPVAILTLSGGATATAAEGIWEAGTLGFTSPEIMAMSLEFNIDLAIICE